MAISYFVGGTLMTMGYQEVGESNIHQTEMEVGLPKQAKKAGKQKITCPITYLYTKAELANWKLWFRNTCEYGSQKINFSDPITEVVEEFQMDKGEYSVQAVDLALEHFYLSFQLFRFI